jgi:general secretion pathway protein C
MTARRWHVATVNGILVAAGAYLAGSTVSDALTALLPPPGTPAVAAARVADAPRHGVVPARYDVIATRDVFASTARRDATRDLRLIGVAMHPPERFAVIENVGDRSQGLYRLGDTVATGPDGEERTFTLTDIAADRVVLDRGGEQYVLARTAPPAEPVPGARDPAPDAVRRASDGEYVLDRRDLRRRLANLDHVATEIRAIPNFKDGAPTGYRVFGIKSGSLYERLGLRNGDVVRRVNTVALTDPTRAFAILQELPRERRVTLEISRGAGARTLTYNVR